MYFFRQKVSKFYKYFHFCLILHNLPSGYFHNKNTVMCCTFFESWWQNFHFLSYLYDLSTRRKVQKIMLSRLFKYLYLNLFAHLQVLKNCPFADVGLRWRYLLVWIQSRRLWCLLPIVHFSWTIVKILIQLCLWRNKSECH